MPAGAARDPAIRTPRCNWCVQWARRLCGYKGYDELNPGDLYEVEAAILMQQQVRRCVNTKSKAHPDVQCQLPATYGDYCFRHRHGTGKRWVGGSIAAAGGAESPVPAYATQKLSCAQRIWSWWKRLVPLHRWRAQGPAANATELAINQTELYSFDALSTIPPLYFFSFADAKKGVWAFDIRTLSHTMGHGFPSMNPYTREALPPAALAALNRRVAWLRARKYQIQHVNTEQLTPEQLWGQRVLDLFLKIEGLGYYANADWFHALGHLPLVSLYKRLEMLWEWRLGLSLAEKERIVPGSCSADSDSRLFYLVLEDHLTKPRMWWARQVLSVAEKLVGSAAEEEHRKLGAMYVLMGLVQVSREAAMALPWVLDLVI